jgi:hypothetical protein
MMKSSWATSRVKIFKKYDVSGTESVPETSCFLNILTWLVAREDFIKSCHCESLKSYNLTTCSLKFNPIINCGSSVLKLHLSFFYVDLLIVYGDSKDSFILWCDAIELGIRYRCIRVYCFVHQGSTVVLKMKAACSSETLVCIYQATWCNIPEIKIQLFIEIVIYKCIHG